jgi:hypothetical protein
MTTRSALRASAAREASVKPTKIRHACRKEPVLLHNHSRQDVSNLAHVPTAAIGPHDRDRIGSASQVGERYAATQFVQLQLQGRSQKIEILAFARVVGRGLPKRFDLARDTSNGALVRFEI